MTSDLDLAMKNTLAILLAAMLMVPLLSSCALGLDITRTIIPLQLGDTVVNLVLHDSGAHGLTYLNLHDDENTAVRAALVAIRRHGGRVFEFRHSGRRNIRFILNGVRYEFDPNRMFNEDGSEASLQQFGPVSRDAISAIGRFAGELLNTIEAPELRAIVTLHNNEGGAYSVLSYSEGGDYEREAIEVCVNHEADPDDFYFVTDNDIYYALCLLEQNAVLQDNTRVTDDGSLSVWSAQNQISYVNIEGQNGHLRLQTGMIQTLHDLLVLGR